MSSVSQPSGRTRSSSTSSSASHAQRTTSGSSVGTNNTTNWNRTISFCVPSSSNTSSLGPSPSASFPPSSSPTMSTHRHHASAAAGDHDRERDTREEHTRAPGPEAALCRYFNTPKGCMYGAACWYRHVVTIRPVVPVAAAATAVAPPPPGLGSVSESVVLGPSSTHRRNVSGASDAAGPSTPAAAAASTTAARNNASADRDTPLIAPRPTWRIPMAINGGESGIGKTPCKFFAAGHCARGDSCWYVHDVPRAAGGGVTPAFTSAAARDAPIPLPASPASAAFAELLSRPRHTSRSYPFPTTSSATVTSKLAFSSAPPPPPPRQPSEPCMICFESPETYGLLEKCSHAFCLECIRSWRNPSAKDTPTALSGVIKMCPACRVPSSFITPSRMHYKEGDERKVGAIRRYKERCGRIPCKYFTKNLSNPFCPFGYDCFYQHTDPETGEPHIFTHGIEDTAQRAAERAERNRERELRRVRRTLDSVGRLLTDEGDFEAFVEAMHQEFGEMSIQWHDEEEEDEDGDEEEEEEEEDEDDEDEEEEEEEENLWDSWEAEQLAAIADEEERYLDEQWGLQHAILASSPIARANPIADLEPAGFHRPRPWVAAAILSEDSHLGLDLGEPSPAGEDSDENSSDTVSNGSQPGVVYAISATVVSPPADSPNPSSAGGGRPPITYDTSAPDGMAWLNDRRQFTGEDGWWV